ncbi:JAB domain-containing protein [Sphingobium olei]|uniref:JAB domain-containing protein n=1 Tax=Sphingobium olei TaxID=420955 RepID=UPI0036D2A89A
MSMQMVKRFGSLGEALAAQPLDRLAVMGASSHIERSFVCLQMAIDHILRGRIADKCVLSNEEAVIEYLRATMAFAPVEQMRVLFLNAANHLLVDEVMASGTVSSVHIYPREVLKRCLDVGATAILLVHNHPSGRPAPSKADKTMTTQIAEAARWFGIAVHDHLIVAREGWVSFRRAGYL